MASVRRRVVDTALWWGDLNEENHLKDRGADGMKILKCINLTLEGPCIIVAIYIQSNEIHNVVALIKFLLALRFQLYMFRTVTVRNM